MSSSLTWLDHDSSEQERMRRVLDLFEERSTVDELGLGAIRDSIADRLFPGTSTIQTRIRYFLFVPWIYRQLEEKRTPARRFRDEARELQFRLSEALTKGGEEEGVIGGWAGRELKRTPDAIYWGGLASWEIRRFEGSIQQYRQAIEPIYRLRGSMRRTDEGELIHDSRTVTWHREIPAPPPGWLESTSPALTREEALFLRDCISISHGDRLLAHLVSDPRRTECPSPWTHPDLASFETEHRRLLEHARLFSQVMHGAWLLYNILLARKKGSQELIDEHEASFDDWLQEVDSAEIARWDLDEFWGEVVDWGHTITPKTRAFVEAWKERVAANKYTLDVPEMHGILEHREFALKGALARLRNRRALDKWGGASGLGRMTYRWEEARRYVNELAAGLAST